MIQYFLTAAKRLAVLVPGLAIVYFSVRDIFPYFDQRLPLSLAVLMTYALAAYVLIPAAIRLIRIVYPPSHLPLYCVTPDGFASDPLNIGIICARRELITAMQKAGWYLADPKSGRYAVRYILSVIFGWQYDNAPVSKMYLFGRKQDLAFEIPVEGGRHHVRFWATTFQDIPALTVRSVHWHRRNSRVQADNLLWVGAASLDVGLAPIRHNFQITHMIHPDTNRERELIVRKLRKAGLIEKTRNLKLGEPYRLINRAWRGHLHTDGLMTIVHLKTIKPPTSPGSEN